MCERVRGRGGKGAAVLVAVAVKEAGAATAVRGSVDMDEATRDGAYTALRTELRCHGIFC